MSSPPVVVGCLSVRCSQINYQFIEFLLKMHASENNIGQDSRLLREIWMFRYDVFLNLHLMQLPVLYMIGLLSSVSSFELPLSASGLFFQN